MTELTYLADLPPEFDSAWSDSLTSGSSTPPLTRRISCPVLRIDRQTTSPKPTTLISIPPPADRWFKLQQRRKRSLSCVLSPRDIEHEHRIASIQRDEPSPSPEERKPSVLESTHSRFRRRSSSAGMVASAPTLGTTSASVSLATSGASTAALTAAPSTSSVSSSSTLSSPPRKRASFLRQSSIDSSRRPSAHATSSFGSIVRRLTVDLVSSRAVKQQNVSRSFTSAFLTTPATVNFSKVNVHEALHEGLASSVYRVSVSGFVFAMKAISVPYENAAHLKEMIDAILISESLSEHDNIVRHIGHDLRNFRSYRQFMVLCTDTLMALVASTQVLTALRIVDIAVQVARGLAFIHARQIIHRDVKCENVMIETVRDNENADPLQVFKLGDLLECCAVTERGVYRANVGTPGFMAPEVYSERANECVYTVMCDIWSFGMLIYQLLTREFPPSDATQTGTRPKFPPSVDANPALPLNVLYEKCTEHAASDRADALSVVQFLGSLQCTNSQRPS